MPDKVILTEKGLKKLKKELEHLIEVKRPQVAKRIAQAKDYGDLSENVEYDEAKNEQMMMEKRIAELRQMIKKADIAKSSDKGEVAIGSKVEVKMNGKEIEYKIVGSFESNPKENKISHSSPIAKALIGCKVGDEVKIDLPAGKQTCEIIKIK